jgi:hypothetical protein
MKVHVVVLSDKDRALIRGLIVAEAARIGYGTKYQDVDPRQPGGRPHWPVRLKNLSRVAKEFAANGIR